MTAFRFPVKGYGLRDAEERDAGFFMGCVEKSILLSVTGAESEHSELWMGDILDVTSIAADGGMMRSERFILENDQKEMIGILWMGISRDQFTCEETGYLLGLFVCEGHRGRGLGKALMACAEEWCLRHGLLSLTLNVGSANTHAKRFYDGLGFGERSTVMRRRLR